MVGTGIAGPVGPSISFMLRDFIMREGSLTPASALHLWRGGETYSPAFTSE